MVSFTDGFPKPWVYTCNPLGWTGQQQFNSIHMSIYEFVNLGAMSDQNFLTTSSKHRGRSTSDHIFLNNKTGACVVTYYNVLITDPFPDWKKPKTAILAFNEYCTLICG